MNSTEFDCQECGELHHLSINQMGMFGRIALEDRAHYIAREMLPGGRWITVVKLHCPYKVGVPVRTNRGRPRKVQDAA